MYPRAYRELVTGEIAEILNYDIRHLTLKKMGA